MSWHLVDADGADLATGRPVRTGGSPTPAGALAASPVVRWPVRLVTADGRSATLAEALGDGGQRVEQVLGAIVSPPPELEPRRLHVLAAATPAGPIDLPVVLVDLPRALEASTAVDRAWLAAVEHERHAARPLLLTQDRAGHLEAAVHAAMLLGTDHLAPPADDTAGRVASGALLWLLGGVVAWALAAPEANPFDAWGELIVRGWWPIGPSGGRLAMTRLERG